MNMHLIFDIGGTFTRCAGVSEGRIIRKEKVSTPKEFEEGMTVCADMGRRVLNGATGESVVAGIAGTFDREKRKIYKIPQLPLWNGKDIFGEFVKTFGLPLILQNDAVLAGLGESVYGAGRGKKIVAYITIGTGVGGARIVKGKIDASVWGFEPGHQVISIDGEKRKLGEMLSGMSIEQEMGKKPGEIQDVNFWEEKSHILSVGIYNALLFWSPDIVILGGSVGEKMNIERIKQGVQNFAGDIFEGTPDIVRAELSDDSGLWGGVALLRTGVESAGVQRNFL
jgi:predicted NBD/HSP70 family sugar kinase